MQKNTSTVIAIFVLLVVAAGVVYVSTNNDPLANGTPEPQKNTAPELGTNTTEKVIRYTDNGFSPVNLEVALGEAVTFINESVDPLWIASAIHPSHELYPEFDQMGSVPTGGTYVFTFTKSGEWKFHNHLNAEHRGVIVVK